MGRGTQIITSPMLQAAKGSSPRQFGREVRPGYKKLYLCSALLLAFVVILLIDAMAVSRSALLTLLAPTVLAGTIGQRQAGSPPTVELQNGTVAGLYQPTYNQDLFLGIPYAQPPLGDLRFRHPEPLREKWNGTLEATAYYPECVGYGGDQIGYEISEDCLVVNIVRPSGMEGQSLPVGAWIHGGGLFMGGATDRRYNLSFIVENSVEIGKPIIGLSMAYRLSAWGFLDGEEVRDEGSTNVGIHDQRLALRWIQDNIGAFGGDPSKVTVFGESAGAWSTGIHTVSYGGRDDGLFAGVIGQSGNSVIPAYNATASQEAFDNVTQAAGCGTAEQKLDCLREQDYETLNAAFNVTGLRFTAAPDGGIVPDSAYNAMLNGDFVKVPYLIGTNSDEGSGGFGAQGINTDEDFRAYLLSEGFNETTAPVIEATYPDIPAIGIPATLTWTLNETWGLQFKRVSAFGGDFAFTAGRRFINQQYARYNVSTYAYRFDTIPYPLPMEIGVAHFQEVAFVFDNTEGLGYADNPFQDKPQSYLDLAELMSKMWVSFIATGDPNGHGIEGAPEWPVYMNGEGGKVVSGQGGYGRDLVFNASNIHIEDDVYRAAGIAALNSMWGSVFGR